jgi:hypothetical protein
MSSEEEKDQQAKDVQALFDQMPDHTSLSFARGDFAPPANDEEEDFPKPLRLVAVFSFAETGFGFGEITVVTGPDGRTYMDTEYTDKETVKRILGRLVDTAVTESDQDPAAHKKYNEIMGRTCSERCKVCHP